MRQVQAVEAISLEVSQDVRQCIGGMWCETELGQPGWSPFPMGQLYYVGQWWGRGVEVSYYILRNSYGDNTCLGCVRTRFAPALLVMVDPDRVPDWVVAEAERECVTGIGGKTMWRELTQSCGLAEVLPMESLAQRRVASLYGRDMQLPEGFLHQYGGRLVASIEALEALEAPEAPVMCWSPDPGDELYWLGEAVAEGGASYEYYALERQRGDVVVLRCVHGPLRTTVRTMRTNYIPEWLLWVIE